MQSVQDKLIIIGTGGHAKEVINVLLENKAFEIVGCIGHDDTDSSVIGFPVLGDDTQLPRLRQQGITHAFIAIGDNPIRARLYHHLKTLGFTLPNAISASVSFFKPSQLGDNILIMPNTLISADTRIENNVIIGAQCYIAHDCHIQAHAHVAPKCALTGKVTIATGAFIGTGCNIIPCKQIGEWSIIGAGSTVITDIPAMSTAIGVPAKVIKKRVDQKVNG